VILPGADAAQAGIVAREVRDAVHALALPHPDNRAAGHVTVSIGAATKTGDDRSMDTPAALILAADMALYAAKRNGRDRIECAPPPAPRAVHAS